MKNDLLAKKDILYKKSLPAPAIKLSPSPVSNLSILLRIFLVIGILLFSYVVFGQTANDDQKAAEYKKVVTERSEKILNTLGLTDPDKYQKLLNEMVNQYSELNAIHDQFKTSVAEIKKQSLPKEETNAAIKKLEEKKSADLLQLHNDFITHLKENLSDSQVGLVKDGMTYRVFPVTYSAYIDMLPRLTTEQKEQIYNWLKEARELAMDEGSSDDKHKVFGKYKGRINNYLSAAGYDMKKEGEEWQKRIKEREAKAKE